MRLNKIKILFNRMEGKRAISWNTAFTGKLDYGTHPRDMAHSAPVFSVRAAALRTYIYDFYDFQAFTLWIIV